MFASALTKKYSLLTFNYPSGYSTNRSLADALAELLTKLDVHNVYLVGQSYGGLFAQVMAKQHPECVKGLILSGTCSMYNDLTYHGIAEVVGLLNPQKLKKNLRVGGILPRGMLVFLMKAAFKKHAPDKKAAKELAEVIDRIKGSISKEYWRLMNTLLADLMNEYGTHKPEDFRFLRNEVLLIFSDEDLTFSDELKDTLVRLMPDPTVVRDIAGGHLALFSSFDQYVREISTFLNERN